MGRKKRVKSLSLKTSKSDEVNGVEENEEEKAEDPSQADTSMASSSSHEHLEKYFDERRRYSTSSQEDEDDYYDTNNLLPMDIQQMILGDGDVSKVTINQEYPEEEESEVEKVKSESVTPLDIYDEILETFQVKKSPNVKCYSPKKLNTETAPVKQTEEMMKDLKITPPVEESGSESFKILKNVLMEMVSETKVQNVEEVEKMELDLAPEIDLPKEETPKEVKTPKKQAKKTEKKVKETKKTEPKKVKSKEPKEPKKPKESKKKETKTAPKPKDVEKMSKKAIKDALKMAENRKKLPPKERFKFPERKLFAKENVVNGEEKEEKTEMKPEVRRRSNRIRANRWDDLSEVVLPPPSLPPPPAPTIPIPVSTPPPPYFDSDKPVKVKSRWRRTSELEMGAGLTSDSDASVSSISALSVKSESQNSPMEIMAPPKLPLVTVHPEIEERLKSFECITANIFLLPRRKNKELNDMQCDCELTKEIVKGEKKGCGTDCLNRMLQIECGPSCSLGNLCTNKLIQNCQNSKLEVVKTMKKGLGLVASANTETGAFLMEYVGEVIDPKEFKKRAKEYSKEKSRHFYFMALDSDSVIDATQKGNISRFINHSCDPNSETQQWLVGGKRRIGFFSVKPISKGEEITFDYKFQRYGKEAQRCYCESANCRGWIGEEPDEDEEEEEEEDEDEEEQEEVKPETEDAKVKEIEENKPPDQETIAVVKTENIEQEKEKKEKKKKEKKKDIVEFITEPDLNEEISKLSSTGMKNQAQTLKMSRLMLRAENVESKCRLLDIVLAAERACLRLFLDYRGLTLLYSWMSGSKTSNNLKIKALKTLEILPITNKTILKDSKVIDVVKDWAYPGNKETTKEKAGEDSNSKSPDSVETLKTESGNSQDSQSLDAMLADEKSSMIVELSKTLISKWADLKEEFRIPKKQRFEQMKEHEREANRGYVDPRDENKATYESRGGVGYRHWPNEKDRNKEKERRNRGRESPESREHRYREKNGLIGGLKLTKVQRRELFELQVKEEEKQRKKQLEEVNEMWLNHKEKCAALGVDPAKTPLYYHNDGFPVLYQPQTGTWVPIPPDAAVENDPVFRHRVAGNMIGPLMPHGFPPPATPPPGFVPQLGAPPFREIMPPGTPGAPPFREILPGTPNIGVPPFREIVPSGTPNHVPPYRDILPGTPTQIMPTVMGRPPGVNVPPSPYHVPPQFNQPPPPLPIASIPYQTPPNPVYPYMQRSPLDNMTPSKTPVVINPTSVQPPPSSIPPPPRKLPLGWKKAKDKEGRFYFYHGKIRKSQWNFPTEQEIAAALAWTSQITANDESESDDDDSDSDDDDDSSSEEEEEKEEEDEEEEAPEKKKVEDDLPMLPGLEPEISPINNQENNEPVLKKRREGLVQVNIISPRDEDENYRKGIKKSKIRETKEKLARAKQRHKKEKMKKAKRCEADTSSDRRIKEHFRVEMARFVIAQLNPYRKPDCDIGRIESNDDFKHLARKLTHFVMLKELRHLSSVEGLVCNDNVKHKAKDFIKKYMAKFGPVYARGPEEVSN